MGWVFTNGQRGYRGSFPGRIKAKTKKQRLKTWCLMPPCLTLSIIKHLSKVKCLPSFFASCFYKSDLKLYSQVLNNTTDTKTSNISTGIGANTCRNNSIINHPNYIIRRGPNTNNSINDPGRQVLCNAFHVTVTAGLYSVLNCLNIWHDRVII